MRVAVFGNCQARPLAAALRAASPSVEVVDTVIVHLAKDAEADATLAGMADADVVLAQRVVDQYPTRFVRTDELRRHFGDKLVVWPNLYYRGYNPEMVYLRDEEHRPLQGPLGDYHISTIHDAWQEGLPQEEAVRRSKAVRWNRRMFADVPDASLAQLREREADADVTISDFVEEHRWRQRLFWTFNHPTSASLKVLAERVLDLVGLPAAESRNGEPLGRWRLPLNPWVKHDFTPDFDDRGKFQGATVDLTGPAPVAPAQPVAELNYRQLVSAYYDVYDAALTRS